MKSTKYTDASTSRVQNNMIGSWANWLLLATININACESLDWEGCQGPLPKYQKLFEILILEMTMLCFSKLITALPQWPTENMINWRKMTWLKVFSGSEVQCFCCTCQHHMDDAETKQLPGILTLLLNPIHTFHEDGFFILLILRHLRQQRVGMQTQRGFPQHLVDLAAPWNRKVDLNISQLFKGALKTQKKT